MKKLLIPLLLLVVILGGCETKEVYTVDFITYEGNTIDAIEVEEETGIVFPAEPTREGYRFLGWYIDDQTIFLEDGTFLTENLTLTARWDPISVSVNFYWTDDYIGSLNAVYSVLLELPPIGLPGHVFEGWFTEDTYETQIEEVLNITENMNVYAKFTLPEIDVPVEGTIDVTQLPYFSYLSETNPVITITVKDIGVMTLELFPGVAKNTVDNMIQYITDGDYTDSPFHRIIEDFMIQGGVVDTNNCPIIGEFESNGVTNDLQHYRGILSTARTFEVDSATSQFFIVHSDTFSLDGEYAAFGGLTSGFNVLDYIAVQVVDYNDSPYRELVIESITVELNGYVPGTVVCAE